jgi:anion-transporting  ArsA/GET3 family ATPase
MNSPLTGIIKDKRLIVCCGAGGVGKTTVSAALAVKAARMGKKVLVLTIDPSKRLAEALGVERSPPEPVRPPISKLRQIGISPPGDLEAWMLDPQVIADTVVEKYANNKEEASSLLSNRIYKNVTAMVAGMQEYTAVQAMHTFLKNDRYDLIILDTPPSRNALHFLEAPKRISRLLNGRIFRFFIPSDTSLIKRAVSTVLNKAMDISLGKTNRVELTTFFSLFSAILSRLNHNAGELRSIFKQKDSSFLVITSPAQEAIEEALYFEKKTRDDLDMPFNGYILNRSLANTNHKNYPDESLFSNHIISELTLNKVKDLAEHELAQMKAHTNLLENIRKRLGPSLFAEALPYISDGVSDLETLATLVDALPSN